jgi:glutathione S-transferase
MVTVHGMSDSGNCYKVRLLLEQLHAPYRWVEVDTLKGESRTAEYLARNPNGRVPMLEYEPGKYLPESNAILAYLAEGTPFSPSERLARAQVLQWMFFEQYSHEPYVAVARFVVRFLPPGHARRAELPRLLERSYQALGVMEEHLAKRKFFVAETYTIADIALYAYTHTAGEGGLDLEKFPAIRAWIKRVEAQAEYLPIEVRRRPGDVSQGAG